MLIFKGVEDLLVEPFDVSLVIVSSTDVLSVLVQGKVSGAVNISGVEGIGGRRDLARSGFDGAPHGSGRTAAAT